MRAMTKKRPDKAKAEDRTLPAYWTPARVLALRERLHLTQTEAGELVGVSQRQWLAWEKGESKPSKPSAILLSLMDERDGQI